LDRGEQGGEIVRPPCAVLEVDADPVEPGRCDHPDRHGGGDAAPAAHGALAAAPSGEQLAERHRAAPAPGHSAGGGTSVITRGKYGIATSGAITLEIAERDSDRSA